MTNHPNFDRAQAILDASRRGDYAPASTTSPTAS